MSEFDLYITLIIGIAIGGIIIFNLFAFGLGYMITLWNLEERSILGLKFGEGQYAGRFIMHYLDVKRMFLRKGSLIFAHGSEGQFKLFKMFGFHMLYGTWEEGRVCKKCNKVVFRNVIVKSVKKTIFNNENLANMSEEDLKNLKERLESGESGITREVMKQEIISVYTCEACGKDYYIRDDLEKLGADITQYKESLLENGTKKASKMVIFYGQLPTKKREMKLYKVTEEEEGGKEVPLLEIIDKPLLEFSEEKNSPETEKEKIMYIVKMEESLIEPSELFENLELLKQVNVQHQIERRAWMRDEEMLEKNFLKKEREFKEHFDSTVNELQAIEAKQVKKSKFKITIIDFITQIMEYVDMGGKVEDAVKKAFDQVLLPKFQTDKDLMGALGGRDLSKLMSMSHQEEE